MKNLLFAVLYLCLAACTPNLVGKDPIVDGRKFIDENSPTFSIEFPFDIELKNIKSRVDSSDENVRSKYYVSTLKTSVKNTYAFVFRDSLYVDGMFTYFTRTDDADIKNKMYIKKNTYGFCTVHAGVLNGRKVVGSTAIRYSGKKYLTAIRIFKILPDDYVFERLENEDKDLLEEHLQYAEGICSQLIGEAELKKTDVSMTKVVEKKRNFTVLDEKMGSKWHILRGTGLVDLRSAKRACASLDTDSGNPARLPSVFELERLRNNLKDDERLALFKGKEYVTSDPNDDSQYGRPTSFSMSTGFADTSFTASLVCVEPNN